MFTELVVDLVDFSSKNMGAKSNNLKNLKDKLLDWINLPESICLPFQVMEYAVAVCDPTGSQKLDRLMDKLGRTTNHTKMSARLLRAKQIVLSLKFNEKDGKLKSLRSSLKSFGIEDFEKAWNAIKKVWASKFNERAFLSIKKIGAKLPQVYMAVLIQKIVKAQYAFVIHTTNPTNGDEDEVYAEACRGLGESLVSDKPGQALSFTVLKQDAAKQRKIK